MAYTARQAQLVTAAYQQYLHRTPSSAEIQREVDEAASRGENEQQWLARVQMHFTGTTSAAGTTAPASTAASGPSALESAIRAAYQQYMGRQPSADELQTQINEVAARGETIAQFQTRVDTHFRGAPPAAPAPAPAAPPAPAGYTPIDFSRLTTYMGGGGREGGDFPTPEQLAINDQIRGQVSAAAKVIPGASPVYGVLPDGQIIDFRTMAPPTKPPDAVTQAFAKLALQNPVAPMWDDIKDQVRIPGRGFDFKGDASAEEQALGARLVAGDLSAAQPLAEMRMKRLQVAPTSPVHQFMKPLTMAALAVGMSALGGAVAGPLLGTTAASAGGVAGATGGLGLTGAPLAAGVGAGGALTSSAVTQGVGTGEIDWRKLATATASGGVGAGAGALTGGLGDLVSGAAGGAAGAGTNVGLTAALGGKVNPWDVLVSAASGSVAKALSGGATALGSTVGSDPQGIGDFVIPPEGAEKWLTRLMGVVGAKGTADMLRGLVPDDTRTGFPSTETPDSPFPPKEVIDRLRAASAAAREQEVAAAMADMRDKMAEFEARKAEAFAHAKAEAEGRAGQQLADFQAKKAEFDAKVTAAGAAREAAREKLREQAAAYLETVRSRRSAPLPPIPAAPAPAPLPVPDPFSPSAALTGQTYGGDFPVSSSGGGGGGDFPVSQQPGAAPQATASGPAPKVSPKQLPLTLLQIQAALSRRRSHG